VTRRIMLTLAEDTTDTECGDCIMSCCNSHCEAFGDKPEERRHPDCIAAERAASRREARPHHALQGPLVPHSRGGARRRRPARRRPPLTERLNMEAAAVLLVGVLARQQLRVPKNRDKGVPGESARELLKLAIAECGEAIEAIDNGHGTTVVLAEIGDAIAFLGVAAWRAIR